MRYGPPIGALLALQVILSVRLQSMAWDDEALYIFAGHNQLEHWQHGAPLLMNYNQVLSGAPGLYPVFAAMLDSVGGLGLVRAFSTLCMLTATIFTYLWTRRAFGAVPAILGALLFVATGPVMFLGMYATYDAPCCALLAIALYVVMTSDRFVALAAAGALVGAAASLKYVCALWGAFVVALAFARASDTLQRRLLKGATVGGAAAAVIGLVALVGGGQLIDGVMSTTLNRGGIRVVPVLYILTIIGKDAGIVLALALAGAALTFRAHRWTLLLALAALAAPLRQAQMSELTSLHKHIGIGLLFAVPLAGVAMEAARSRLWLLPIPVLVGVAAYGVHLADLQNGTNKLNPQIVRAALGGMAAAAQKNPGGARFLGADAPVFRYYYCARVSHRWRNDQHWQNLSPATLDPLAKGTFDVVVMQNSSTVVWKAVDETAGRAISTVRSSKSYTLAYSVPLRAGFKTLEWSMWTRGAIPWRVNQPSG